MTMRHVSDQLPLWVEDDLDAPAMAAVEAHLAACDACRAEAEAFRESQAWLKEGHAPFADEDREALRRAVLAQVQAGADPRRAWWGAALGVLAAAALIIFLVRPNPAQLTTALPSSPPAPVQTLEPPLPSPAVKPVRAPRRRATPRPLEQAAGPGVSRIEIQTRNPQIRIIWLARPAAPQGSPDSI